MIPQYSQSTDPEVLAVIARNAETLQDFRRRADEFARKYGSTTGTFYVSGMGGTTALCGISARAKPTQGQWTRTYSGNGWRPFKNNPAWKEMDAIEHRREAIPGLPEIVHSVGIGDGRRYIMTPHPFVHEGTAWLGFNHAPDPNDSGNKDFGPQWVEVKTSEYYAAREAAFPDIGAES